MALFGKCPLKLEREATKDEFYCEVVPTLLEISQIKSENDLFILNDT